jgi:tRNA threonylcarbamoyl adenosine modification protein (Sua5/YciO/YrdC/YwlC family)
VFETSKVLLTPGSVGVIPTDTVYGVVACAADETAVRRLYAVKSRENKPGTVIAASITQLVALGIPRRYLKAVEQYWPGPISVVVPSVPELAYLDASKGTLAVRIPSDPSLIPLLEQTGPLLTSSANQPGEPPATTVAEARGYFGDEVDFYVDGGDLSGRQPSTVIRIVDDAVEVLREGAVKISENGEIES